MLPLPHNRPNNTRSLDMGASAVGKSQDSRDMSINRSTNEPWCDDVTNQDRCDDMMTSSYGQTRWCDDIIEQTDANVQWCAAFMQMLTSRAKRNKFHSAAKAWCITPECSDAPVWWTLIGSLGEFGSHGKSKLHQNWTLSRLAIGSHTGNRSWRQIGGFASFFLTS